MNIVYVVPGTCGAFYCPNGLRDSLFISALREAGHHVTLVPLYLPCTPECSCASAVAPLFYGALRIGLQQALPLFRRLPRRISRWLDSPALLQAVSRRPSLLQARSLEKMTLSVLQAEHGRQAYELERLVQWLSSHSPRPEIIQLSTALLAGLARRIRHALNVPVASFLGDEDKWVDAMTPAGRARVWGILRERARDVDAWVAPSRFGAERMTERLGLPSEKLVVIPPGVRPEEYPRARLGFSPPVLGFLSRLSPDQGLDTLVAAFLLLRQEPRLNRLRLAVMGSAIGSDSHYGRRLSAALQQAGVWSDVMFHPTFDRARRMAFLESLSVLSVPVPTGEAFGLYLLEAMACGVPVVQPRLGAFPEILAQTGAGCLFEPNDAPTLAVTLRSLLLDPDTARRLGACGPEAVAMHFNLTTSAQRLADLYGTLSRVPTHRGGIPRAVAADAMRAGCFDRHSPKGASGSA